jgi:hypothetical protein
VLTWLSVVDLSHNPLGNDGAAAIASEVRQRGSL